MWFSWQFFLFGGLMNLIIIAKLYMHTIYQAIYTEVIFHAALKISSTFLSAKLILHVWILVFDIIDYFSLYSNN